MYEIDRLLGLVENLDNEKHVLFDECLLWDGTLNKYGQGRVRQRGKWHSVPRVAYEHVYGPVAKGMQVLHHCDVPNCVNPFHLFEGTQQDNMVDAAQKRRLNLSKQGEKHPAAKLSDADVDFIRKSDLKQTVLGRMFGCAQSHISSIKIGRTRNPNFHRGKTVNK